MVCGALHAASPHPGFVLFEVISHKHKSQSYNELHQDNVTANSLPTFITLT